MGWTDCKRVFVTSDDAKILVQPSFFGFLLFCMVRCKCVVLTVSAKICIGLHYDKCRFMTLQIFWEP